MTKKTNEIVLYAVIFCLIAVCAFNVATNYKLTLQKNAPTPNRIYQANFNNRKCDFCGTQAAAWYELSHSRQSGETKTEYLCDECHTFLHYDQFAAAFKRGATK